MPFRAVSCVRLLSAKSRLGWSVMTEARGSARPTNSSDDCTRPCARRRGLTERHAYSRRKQIRNTTAALRGRLFVFPRLHAQDFVFFHGRLAQFITRIFCSFFRQIPSAFMTRAQRALACAIGIIPVSAAGIVLVRCHCSWRRTSSKSQPPSCISFSFWSRRDEKASCSGAGCSDLRRDRVHCVDEVQRDHRRHSVLPSPTNFPGRPCHVTRPPQSYYAGRSGTSKRDCASTAAGRRSGRLVTPPATPGRIRATTSFRFAR
jgi:hypothetical protein